MESSRDCSSHQDPMGSLMNFMSTIVLTTDLMINVVSNINANNNNNNQNNNNNNDNNLNTNQLAADIQNMNMNTVMAGGRFLKTKEKRKELSPLQIYFSKLVLLYTLR